MTDQEHLERAYRRLLAWYPREFRDENGPEILAVLMAEAPDGQRRPGLAGSADLIRSGLWMRLRPGVPRSARTVRAAVWLMYAGAAVSAAEAAEVTTHEPAVPAPGDRQPYLARRAGHRAGPGGDPRPAPRGRPAGPRRVPSWSGRDRRRLRRPDPGYGTEAHPADWTRYGRGAGYRRNAETIALGADGCVAFIRGGSPGSTDTVRLARVAGIPVWLHTQP